LRKFKLSPRGDGPFKIHRKINDSAYLLEVPKDYGVSLVFNVCDLTPFVGMKVED